MIYDIPWDAVKIERIEGLPEDIEVREYQVVMRGCKKQHSH